MSLTAQDREQPHGSAPAPRRGLTAREAAERLRAEGPNELPELERRTALRIVLEVVREPMFALLLGAGVLYLLIGSHGEALVLFGFGALCLSDVAMALVAGLFGLILLDLLKRVIGPGRVRR